MARKKKKNSLSILNNEIKAIILATLAGISMASLLFTDHVGALGMSIKNFLYIISGKSSIVLPFFLLVYSFKLMFDKEMSIKFNNRVFGIVLFYWTFLVTTHVITLMPIKPDINASEILNLGVQGGGGGVFGAILAVVFLKGIGTVGTLITSVSFLAIAIILILDISFSKMLSYTGEKFKRLGRFIIENLILGSKKIREKNKEALTKKDIEIESVSPLVIHDTITNSENEKTNQLQFTFEDYNDVAENINEKNSKEEFKTDENGNIVVKFPQKRNDFVDTTKRENDLPEIKKVKVPYTLPPLTILQKTVRLREGRSKNDIEAQAKILVETLQSFGVSAKVTHIHRGPTITRFEMQPAIGVKVSRILNLSDDLALSLAATGIRIEAPIPGKAAIGIEVPNATKASVYLREVIESKEFTDNQSKLTVALGKNIAGEALIADFTQMPHILIAGATGSGKSVCVNTIIASILFKAKPDEVKFLMVDPKVVELNIYNGIPHLLAPVVTDPKNAAFALKKVVKEMEHRYELFAKLGVRDINRFNNLSPNEKLPYIVVIIDELADLMMVAPNDVEDCICRLAQMARASGIHLIVATQRPSVDVITGVIKANITSRIAFSVSSQADSRTILDMGGAEKLLGKGDMLFYPVGAPKPIRAQSSFISDEEVEKLVDFVKDSQTPEYDDNFEVEEQNNAESYNLDELFAEAARLVVDSQQASISLLQRRFRIGYTRAARIVDDLEKMGIVGGFEGSKARQVLVSSMQLEEMLK